jgi:hypothetical protein
MCMTRDGVQWGEHRNCDELAVLAQAANLGKYMMMDMRDVLPGGMPFFSWTPRSPIPDDDGASDILAKAGASIVDLPDDPRLDRVPEELDAPAVSAAPDVLADADQERERFDMCD